jgi:hypothetical protein
MAGVTYHDNPCPTSVLYVNKIYCQLQNNTLQSTLQQFDALSSTTTQLNTHCIELLF